MTKMATVLCACSKKFIIFYMQWWLTVRMCLLEESTYINKGTEAQSDTRKDINPENEETIHMDVQTPDENKCVNTKAPSMSQHC